MAQGLEWEVTGSWPCTVPASASAGLGKDLGICGWIFGTLLLEKYALLCQCLHWDEVYFIFYWNTPQILGMACKICSTFFFLATLCSLQDLCSPTRDWTMAVKARSPNTGLPEHSRSTSLKTRIFSGWPLIPKSQDKGLMSPSSATRVWESLRLHWKMLPRNESVQGMPQQPGHGGMELDFLGQGEANSRISFWAFHLIYENGS